MKILIILFCAASTILNAQTIEKKIDDAQKEIQMLNLRIEKLNEKLEGHKLEKVISDLDEVGYPSENPIKHSAMVLEYDEKHEQPSWVMHMVLPDIATGQVTRSNDFRIDPKIASGTTVQEDYFLTDTLASGEVLYDGFGYDRGHLAPSADFRWSQTALSESYFYSNISPQLADFNRLSWADLETFIRGYVIQNKVPLYIFTAPVLHDNLPKITRAINTVSIPTQFVKVAYDAVNQRAIAFLMPNKHNDYPIESFMISVNEAEEILNMNIFPTLDESIKSTYEKSEWFTNGDVSPLQQPNLPKYHFNTIVGGRKTGKDCTVCGTIVASRYSRKGHLWLNLDKKYPNQLFSAYIKKDDLPHFPYDPKLNLESKVVCFSGKVQSLSGVPTIRVKSEHQIKLFNQR